MSSSLSPWLALAGLGAFHGLNPAMGWLFAVALGLHRRSRGIVWLALIPIALGHALSVAAVVLLMLGLGTLVETRHVEIVAALLLIGWAAYHWRFAHRHRVRVGMTAGLAGLGLWSFLMATAHGAGLMLLPVLIPICLAAAPAQGLVSAGSLPISLAAIGIHTLAMLAVTAAVSSAVYEIFGLAFLRRGWVNLDLAWIAALVVAGFFLIAA
ncbi:hypothetical protein LNKW23_37270 [Paralimibaculum aggregatum]|uniref:Arginine/ornithine antiporter ArcD n=1 Tax=Paralimibaculum aggregatum TaxID=3036245 RepID=A0ABQ6LMT5_9RHOB|nr:hypothetical protein [Limibaculum sp. NKW23]GMG84511.1 hypothetical protein LNKW23_37270 [Limibaculum sp. NKW23]